MVEQTVDLMTILMKKAVVSLVFICTRSLFRMSKTLSVA